MKNYILAAIAICMLATSGCFWAGLGLGAVGGGAAMHAYDSKPVPPPVVEYKCEVHNETGVHYVPCNPVDE